MIRRLIAFYNSDTYSVLLAGVSITAAMSLLKKVIDSRTAQLAEVNQQLSERRRELAAATDTDAKQGAYPAPVDVDPLGTGGRIVAPGSFNGFEPVEPVTVAPGPVPEYSGDVEA